MLKRQAYYCAAATVPDRPPLGCGPSAVQVRDELHKQPSVEVRSSVFQPRLVDCPVLGCGPSARHPRFAGGTTGDGFECSLFLWVPKDTGNSIWLVDLTYMEFTKLYIINGEMPWMG
jgi:hypothetical protein